MQQYIGTKIIQAEPQAKNYGPTEGQGQPGYKVVYPDGYTSWSPAEAFEEAYRPCEAMNFGLAIEALKKGHRVARAGWNGKGMWLVLVPGTPSVELRPGTPYAKALERDEHVIGDRIEILPHIDMWTVNSKGRRAMLPGWLASQTDMLADDWKIVREAVEENDFQLGKACDLSGEGTCEACQ